MKDWRDNGSLERELEPYKFLVNNGFKVTLLTYGDNEDFNLIKYNNINIIPIYTLYKKSKFSLINIIKSLFIRIYLGKNNFDVIKTNQVWGAWVALLLNFATRSKLVIRLGYEPYMNSLNNKNILKKILYKYNSILSYNLCDSIIVTTDQIKEFVCKNFKISKFKIRVIPNYIDTKQFSPKNSVYKYKNRVLYVGRLENEKNIIETAKIFIRAKVGLDIIGAGSLENELINLKKNHNANINIIGTVTNKALVKYYRRYKIFLLLSKYEGHPKSLLEAMSTSLIPIGLNKQGINSLIKHNKNGYLIDNISKELLSLIDSIFLDDKNKLAVNARQSVVDNCSKLKIFRKELSFYNELLERI